MINSWISVIALTLSLAFACGVTAQVLRAQDNAPTNPQPARGAWTEERPLASPRVEVAVAAVGQALHAIGGNSDGVAAETTHEAYDPSVNTWHMLAPLPEARDHVAVAEAGANSSPSAASRHPCTRALPPIPLSTIPPPIAGADCRPCRLRADRQKLPLSMERFT